MPPVFRTVMIGLNVITGYNGLKDRIKIIFSVLSNEEVVLSDQK